MDRDTATPQVDSLPGDNAREWVEYHRSNAAPSTYVYDFVWDISSDAEGPFCTDVDGNVLLDFTSHVAAAPLGYNNPKIMDRLREFDLVDPLKIAGQDFYVSNGERPGEEEFPGPAGLMDRLTDITSQYDMDTVFLSNSGAEAVENAIKISYDESDGAKYGFAFEGAFHGRTLGALSLNRSKSVYRRKFPEISGIVDLPYCDKRTCSGDSCSCGFFPDGSDVSALRKKLDPDKGHIHPDDVAYIILEPIQGEGGYRIPSDAFMDELAAVTDEYDITLISDEIQAGVGRTGEMWGSDHFSIEPDVITSAKALRVGATISRSDVFPEEKSRLSSTWGAGDIIASLQGALTLDAIHDYDLMDNAVERGQQFKQFVRDADLGPVTDVRGKGLMLGVEFDSKERRNDVQEACLQKGLLTLACGYDVIRILPPLDVTEREIEIGASLFCDAVEDVS
ncbi:aminotransferase class III-fold pyridoxal phosphate-dependent enzyme [Halogeometricum borinquense]|uniref:Aminotransferase class III-fold pyridoxal phosphate-dependent enzyme n=1 Tax=Halogeometricum borinquense TaxID=60847 RepID=A0A6C0UKC7_9EURY|nr:aminotransferase class III-fold pyridoxal phosphate-dependent enzyme [Halogeometricum borinquense]QIB74781.1 aminotransferase class III-fold pyridoxal phosphate-dependent enzyme [Halogeometricum borinquense]QIQ76273.1 aminotransferase class III-fold pyridoxal phosphate-dependent enzyme [Halogeometricum borinquense]